MDTAEHIGHTGALAVMPEIKNVRRNATRVTVSIGVAILAVMATVVLVAHSTVSPVVKLSADSTALIMGGTTIPAPDDYWVESVMDQFITPTHPGRTITPVAVITPEEYWPVTGLMRLIGLAIGDPNLWGPGGPGWPDEPWWKLSGLFDLTPNQSLQAGVADLEAAMSKYGNDHLLIYGNSQGAAVAILAKRKLAERYPAGTPAPDIQFVLGGDTNLPNGGLSARFPGLYIPVLDLSFNGPEPTNTQFHTDVITRKYDGAADFPLYPLNLVATLNAVLGFLYLHTHPFDVSLPSDPTTSPAYQGTHGDTSYYFFETQDLPLFAPFRMLGVPEALIDVVEPYFRVLVELGYERSIPPWEPTPARLIPTLDPAKVITDLVNAIGEGVNNAAAFIGLPPLLSTPAPVTLAAPPTEAVQTDIPHQATSTIPSQTEQVTSTNTAAGTDRMPTETATRTDRLIQTEQLGSTEPAIENGQASTNTARSTNELTGTAEAGEMSMWPPAAVVPSASAIASTSERVKPTSRPATPRPVGRNSFDATEQPRGFPHRRNGPATSTTDATAADPATTAGSSSAPSVSAASSSAAGNSSAGDSSGGAARNST